LILVDSSAWVEYLRQTESPVDRYLTDLIDGRAELATTEVVVLELLAGASNPRDEQEIRYMLMGLTMLRLEGLAGFEEAATIYRRCRAEGSTPRGLIDCLVAVPAIAAGTPILAKDRDFDVLARHTPLQVVALDD
jgi:predicted nucleic acid-binding protein